MSPGSSTESDEVNKGLQLLATGKVREAVACWKSVLARAPSDPRARGYLDYLRNHLDDVRERLARGERVDLDAMMSQDFLTLDEPAGASGARATQHLGSGSLGRLKAPGPREKAMDADRSGRWAGALDLDRDLELGQGTTETEREPPTLDLSGMALPGEVGAEGTADVEVDFSTADRDDDDEQVATTPRQRPMEFDFDDIALPVDAAGETASSSQSDRAWPPRAEVRPARLPGSGSMSLGPSLASSNMDAEKTEELDAQEATQRLARSPLAESDFPSTEVVVKSGDETLSVAEALERDILAAIDARSPDGGDEPDRVRRRVEGLIARACAEHAAGRGQIAVVAANLAMREAPESVVAQKLIHQHEAELNGVFVTYLGRLDLVPVLAKPLAELGGNIDARDAFVLTQIDGILSLSDVVDVSGMPALSAHSMLCRFLVEGYILLS